MSKGEKYPKLERQPLTLVLAEFRFGPAADMSGAISDFCGHTDVQSAIFEERLTQEVQTGPEGISIRKPGKIWFSLNHDQGRMIQLEKDRLIVATTKYPRFDAFAGECLNNVRALEKAVKPENLLRVGLRYNDAVVPLEGENLEQYLDAKLLPVLLLESRGGIFERHKTETRVRTHSGLLALRVLMGRHGLGVMPDLAGNLSLELPVSVPKDRVTAVLDFDHFWKPSAESTAPFTAKEVDKRLRALHQAARAAFWEITTDFARRERWA